MIFMTNIVTIKRLARSEALRGFDSRRLNVKAVEVFVMSYKISDDCISCGACVGNCPCDAIAEGEDHFEIDPDKCCDCGACATGCPVEAILEG